VVTIDDVKKHLTPEECAALDLAMDAGGGGTGPDTSLSEWILGQFRWEASPQGAEYWSAIHNRLIAIENGEQPADRGAQDDRLADGDPVFGDSPLQSVSYNGSVIGFVERGSARRGDPAFLGYRELSGREFAAITLRVPNSGTEWLDDMIRDARRMDAAQAAMAARFGAIHIPSDYHLAGTMASVAEQAHAMADELAVRGGAA